MSLSELCARRLLRKNFAAKFTPVFLCTALRTAANFPLQRKARRRQIELGWVSNQRSLLLLLLAYETLFSIVRFANQFTRQVLGFMNE